MMSFLNIMHDATCVSGLSCDIIICTTHTKIYNALIVSIPWSLVEVHSFIYVSFMGQTLINNSWVDFTLVGDDMSGNDSIQCHTDLSMWFYQ